ncbi:hypothetical protein AAKU58_000768 [Oxalobacteraceae bacterium GrIS 1.18]
MRINPKALATLAICASLIAALVVWAARFWQDESPLPQAASQDSVNQSAANKSAGNDWVSQSRMAPMIGGAPKKFMDAAGSINLNGLTVNQYINRLYDAANKGDKKAAFNIYRAESICANITMYQQMDRVLRPTAAPGVIDVTHDAINDAQAVCADFNISPKERIYYLTAAANGGIPEAQISFFNEGPYGIERTFSSYDSNDPYVLKWNKDAVSYLTDAATQGNADALVTLGMVYDDAKIAPQDLQLALTYELAAVDIPGMNPGSLQGYIDHLANQLTPDQVSAATAAAKELVNRCCAGH